jgi:hypothetical protein
LRTQLQHLARRAPSLRRRRSALVATLAAAALALCFAASDALATGCGELSLDGPASQADLLMESLERDFRRRTRVVRMDIQTTYSRPSRSFRPPVNQSNRRTLWGVFDSDADATRMLYVFSGPGRLAGTTLLMHDRIAADEPDAMWVYLRSFGIFKQFDSSKQRVRVPGTALTYEDSRGFIPLDKYRFFWNDEPSPDASVILACPRSPRIQEDVGYRSLQLWVDPAKRLVREVRYEGLGGGLLKTYRLIREIEIDAAFFPAEVELTHVAEGFRSDIRYEHWLLKSPPPAGFFAPNTDQSPFLDRLRAQVEAIGQGERIRAELARADEQVREFEEKLRRIQESGGAGRRPRD